MGEVLVLVDHVDGEVKKVTAELVTAARRLGEPSAVVVGGPGAAGRLAGLVAENAERLAVIETRDSGKVIRKTRGQIAGVPAIYQYFAGAADKIEGRTYAPPQTNFFTYPQKRPVGVVAAVLPWNSPPYLLANKLAPALAAGCRLRRQARGADTRINVGFRAAGP